MRHPGKPHSNRFALVATGTWKIVDDFRSGLAPVPAAWPVGYMTALTTASLVLFREPGKAGTDEKLDEAIATEVSWSVVARISESGGELATRADLAALEVGFTNGIHAAGAGLSALIVAIAGVLPGSTPKPHRREQGNRMIPNCIRHPRRSPATALSSRIRSCCAHAVSDRCNRLTRSKRQV